MAGSLQDLQRLLDKAAEQIPEQLGSIIEVQGLNFINKNFQDQGFNDEGLEKWPKRKFNDHRKGRSVLIDKGVLWNSFRAKRTKLAVIFYTHVKYAQIHNEGGRIRGTQSVKEHDRKTRGRTVRVKSHTRNVDTTIPKRQFLGNSKYLEDKISQKLTKTLDRLFK